LQLCSAGAQVYVQCRWVIISHLVSTHMWINTAVQLCTAGDAHAHQQVVSQVINNCHQCIAAVQCWCTGVCAVQVGDHQPSG
jgi:hypothetical protein